MRKFCCFILTLFLATAANCQSVAFVHVHVIPMDRNIVLPDHTVIVADGVIKAVGPSATMAPPKDAQVIQGHGQYLVPGLADMHVHLYFAQELWVYVANGVTTVFNLNGRPADLNWRTQTASGMMVGPTIYSAGPTFDHPRTADEAVKEVDRQAADGYDAIKIYNQVSAAEYSALTAEAHRKNLVLVGHVAREPGFAATLAAGQNIAHAEEYLYTFFNHDPNPGHELTHSLDAGKIPQAVAMTRASGVSVIATLVAYHNIVRQLTALDDYLKNPDMQYLAPSMIEQLRPGMNSYQKRITKEEIPSMMPNYDFQKKLVKALHDGGVPILAGTDAAWLGVPGFSLLEEIENFQDIGFTPYDALKTATTNAAALLKQSDAFGSVSVGKRADLILVSRNPLDDVHNLRQISGVMVRGKWYSDSDRKALLAQTPSSYTTTVERLTQQVQGGTRSVDRYLELNDPFGELAGAVLGSMASTLDAQKLDALLLRVQQSDPKSPLISEEVINQLGYNLLGKKKSDLALSVFKLNTQLYPRSGNTFDSLAETYLSLGNKPLARQNYQKALEVQLDYPNAEGAKKILATQLQ